MRNFFSKVLLFGEYSVIQNSLALSFPYELFEGMLTFKRGGNGQVNIDPELWAFVHYLKSLKKEGRLNFDLDCNSFEFDVSQGLKFDSTIPQGYGVGSSGALCAAIFDRYGLSAKEQTKNILKLKDFFSLMEAHFHGESSGIDPLISYLNTPVLIKEKGDLRPIIIPRYDSGDGGLFLANTGRSRRTEPLVNLFLEKLKDREFASLCLNTLGPINNNCINFFLEGQNRELYLEFKKLSLFQNEHFQAMIPQNFKEIWRDGIANDQFYLKLCGAGGGGFLLGITKSFKKAEAELKKFGQHPMRPLFFF